MTALGEPGSRTTDSDPDVYELDLDPSEVDNMKVVKRKDPDLSEDDLLSLTRLESLTLGVANGHFMAGNQIHITAEGSTNSRIAGVVFEKHIHYGTSTSSVQEEVEEVLSESSKKSREVFSSLVSFYINRYSWMTAWEGGPRHATEDLYVGLRMEPMDRSGKLSQGDARKKKILFDPFSRTGVVPRTVLIRGDPGFGKTTLCRKIAYDWAGQGKTFPGFRNDRTVVLYLDASALAEDADLEDELLRLAVRKDSASPEELDEAKQILTSFDRNVIVLLDGYVGLGALLREQVDRLVGSTSSSLFCKASVVVTSRPDVEEETLHLFQRNFFLKGFSFPLTQKLVGKYFKHTADVRGSRCLAFFQLYHLKGLSPASILALCRCETRKSNVEEILHEWIFRLIRWNGQEIEAVENEEIEEKVQRLGAFFWKRFGKRTNDFSCKELESDLGEDSELFLNCRLLKTTGIGTDRSQLVWEPLHEFLKDGIAAYNVERRWSLCTTAAHVGQFLNGLFPRLQRVDVECSLDPANDRVHFCVQFRYRHFHLLFNISENLGECFVFTSSSPSALDVRKHAFRMSCLIALRKKQDSDELVNDLRTLFSDTRALKCLTPFLSPSKFEKVCLAFSVEETCDAATLFDRRFTSFASLRRRSREFHVAFNKGACAFVFVRSVLKCVLKDDRLLKFDDALDVVQTLRRTAVTPSFQAAHVYGQQCIRRKYGEPGSLHPSRKLCDRLELFFHTDAKTDELLL